MQDKLVIVAHVAVQPEFAEMLAPEFEAVVEATRKEEGNISYDLYVDVNDPNRLTFVEVWQSQQAIDSHNASDHFRTFAKADRRKASLEVSVLKQKL
mgnify:FL=1